MTRARSWPRSSTRILRGAGAALVCIVLAFPAFAGSEKPEPSKYQRHAYAWGLIPTNYIELVDPIAEGESDGSISFDYHNSSQAFVCPKESPFFCFMSSEFALAVPRDLNDGVDEWKYRGVTFKVVERDFLQLVLERRIENLMVIKGSKSGPGLGQCEKYFLYSQEHGLLGFQILGGQKRCKERVWWLVGADSGFGASRFER